MSDHVSPGFGRGFRMSEPLLDVLASSGENLRMSVLNLIKDSTVRQEVTATIDLDPEKTPDHRAFGPQQYLLQPDILMIHWVSENGGKWVRQEVTIRGYLLIDQKVHANDSRRALFKWWESDDLPKWVSEIVQEYKPREVQ